MQRRQFLSLVPQAGAVAALPTFATRAFAQEAGLSANAVTIGSSAALTGPLSGFGLQLKSGIDAALVRVNGRGGVNGRKLQFNVVDDAYVPAKTVDNVKKMISDSNTFALMSVMGTPNNLAAAQLIEDANIPHVAPLTGANSLRNPAHKNTFHVRASYNDETKRLVQQLTRMGITKITIVYLDNGFGKEVMNIATQALAGGGIKPMAQIALAADAKNLDAVVKATMDSNAGAVFLATAGAASTQLVGALRKASRLMPIAGLSVALTEDGLRQLGESAAGIAVTMVFPDPNRARLQIARDFQADMQKMGTTTYSLGAFEAYINTLVMAEGLQRAGRDLTRAKLRQALASIRNHDLGGFAVDFEAAPFVASKYIDLGILGPTGRFVS
jgi:branched-chain amino acid transport system substrate-binding protein